LEYLPTKVQTERGSDGKNKWSWTINAEAGRAMDKSANREGRIYVHRSVEQRINYIKQYGIPQRDKEEEKGKKPYLKPEERKHLPYKPDKPFTNATFNGKSLTADQFLALFRSQSNPYGVFEWTE